MDRTMSMDYNLDELDSALSEVRHQRSAVSGPPRDSGTTGRANPGTRRGSLVPTASPGAGNYYGSGGGGRSRQPQGYKLNLFHFDLRELVRDLLLTTGESRVSYHEYAVFSPPDVDPHNEQRTPSIMAEGEDAKRMLRQALKSGYGLNNEGDFTAKPKGAPQLKGRVRQIIAYRRPRHKVPDELEFEKGIADGLELTVDDYNCLNLHAATLPSLQRVTVESSFWNSRRDTLHLILSFSPSPQPPYDFLSMRYDLRRKTTTALIRRSFDTRWHEEDALDEYERRLDSCRDRWSHPLVLPIVLLQVQLYRTEEAVVANNGEVLMLEAHVDAVTGTTGQANAEAYRQRILKSRKLTARRPPGPLKRLSTLKEKVGDKIGDKMFSGSSSSSRSQQHYNTGEGPGAQDRDRVSLDPDDVPPQTIHLMKEAHDVLKGAIKLLDTLRWMERAMKLIMQAGDELDARLKEMRRTNYHHHHPAAGGKGDVDPGTDDEEEEEEEDDLSLHWHEMRQYLDCIWRLCTSLETDRRMSELRCRAQIDIIYSKMAQEDNNLNARMAVASTRDSSSMKALAVITAIFLPGEYMGTLFGVDFFNWEEGTAGDPSVGADANPAFPRPVIMPSFWIYWAFTIPLTIFIVAGWRAWWVNQDRYFRRHLSMELSNERYWTTDGRPRDLETSFLQDFLSVFRRGGALTTANTSIVGGHHHASALGGASADNNNITGSRAREARKKALSIDSHETAHTAQTVQMNQQKKPGLLGGGWTTNTNNTTPSPGTSFTKDEQQMTEDSTGGGGGGNHTRFRKISFAGPRQPDPDFTSPV